MLARAADAPGALTVVVGPEAGLALLVVQTLLDAQRRADPETTVERISASGSTAAAAIADAAAPTLFGGVRCLVVEGLEALTDEVEQVLRAVMGAGNPDSLLILVHSGAAKGRGVLNEAARLDATEYAVQRLRREAYPEVAVAHADRLGARLSAAAATAMVDILGDDLQSLLAATTQLAADSEDGRIDAGSVHRALFGHGEVNQFALADLVYGKRGPEALVLFHRLVDLHGEQSAAIMTASALSFGLRGLARLAGAGSLSRRPDWEIARETGIPAWKVSIIAGQLRNWPRRGELAAAAVRLSRMDADLKGGMAGLGSLDPVQKSLMVQQVILEMTAS